MIKFSHTTLSWCLRWTFLDCNQWVLVSLPVIQDNNTLFFDYDRCNNFYLTKQTSWAIRNSSFSLVLTLQLVTTSCSCLTTVYRHVAKEIIFSITINVKYNIFYLIIWVVINRFANCRNFQLFELFPVAAMEYASVLRLDRTFHNCLTIFYNN